MGSAAAAEAGERVPAAASVLLAGVLDGARRTLLELARTPASVHYATGLPTLPVLSLCRSGAVLLPHAMVSDRLPAPGPVRVEHGRLQGVGCVWWVARWWRPRRPSLPQAAPALTLRRLQDVARAEPGIPRVPEGPDGIRPGELVGAGPGLTPAGDDVLAGALVTAHAVGDPRAAAWRRETLRLISQGKTTAVSSALLRHAADGYATPQLADLLEALGGAGDLDAAARRLMAVGHTSGPALLQGVLHTLSTGPTGRGREAA